MKLLSQLDDNKQIAFYSDLLDRLPTHIHGANSKTASSNFIPKEIAVHSCKFIRFNTKSMVNTLVFDIDNVTGNAEYWHKRFIEQTAIKPSYTLKTDNGVQVGIFLNKPVFIKDYDGNNNINRARLSKLKKIIGQRLQFTFMSEDNCLTDEAGSNRLLGVWRNPILHETVISTATYSLDALIKHFKMSEPVTTRPQARNTLKSPPMNVKMTLSTDSKIQSALNDGFYQGNRNNYMFAFGFKTVFQDRSTLPNIEAIMQEENKSYGNSMSENEITAIARSIEKMAPTMYQPTKRKPAKYREYMWKNNIHGLYNRRSFGAFVTNKVKREKRADNIIEALTDLFQRGISKPTNKQVLC